MKHFSFMAIGALVIGFGIYSIWGKQHTPVNPLVWDASDSSPKYKRYDIEIDYRCETAIVWGIQLMVLKQNGTTKKDVEETIQFDYFHGSLSDSTPEGIAYLLDIVDIVYSHKDDRTDEEMVDAALEINDLCSDTLKQVELKAKETSA